MCLIAWNWQPGTVQPFLLAANRDEFYARPTDALRWWDGGEILAGRDLSGGGTWLGVTRSGRMAALTNYRDPANFRPLAPSRGMLVVDFLCSTYSAEDYLRTVAATAELYNPFNLLVFDARQMAGLESRHKRIFSMSAGVGSVSNADFFTSWPKLEKLRCGMERLDAVPLGTQNQILFDLLGDTEPASDDLLPNTGITRERERALSPAFVRTPDYGTRASTLLRLGMHGVWMEERRFDSNGLVGVSQFCT